MNRIEFCDCTLMDTKQTINIYCDESCHLEHDRETAMVLGAIWCPKFQAPDLHRQISELKTKHGLSRFFEIKWGKVSRSKLSFYESLVNLFFSTSNLNFRGWVIPDKSVLRHNDFGQTHDDYYYKMYFSMLKVIIRPTFRYHIYLDIKDTQSRRKLQKLHDVLANANYDFSREIIENMQHVHSHDVGLLQLADFLIGALSYSARGLTGSSAKQHIIAQVKNRSGLSLTQNTLPSATKFNICFWRPGERI